MNNQKRLWKTGHFKWIRILLCIVLLFVPSWAAKVPNGEVKFKMFENKDRNVETEILRSLKTTQNVFALPAVKKAVLLGLTVGIISEFWAPATNMLFIVVNLLAQESDWQESFAKTIANELERGIALGQLQWMKSTMDTINAKFDLMNEGNPMRDRVSIAKFVHRECDRMLNLFARVDSFVKKHPLLGTSLLIALAQFVALFHPIAKTLIKLEAMTPELSCKMSNILLDYRPRMINARLEKLHEDSTEGLVYEVNNLRYILSGGNNKTIPATFDCEKSCISDKEKGKLCLIDDFGDSWHTIPWSCARHYVSILRQRVEELFLPIESLDSICADKPKATGFGWLTIKFKEVRGFQLANKQRCELFSDCDPFVRLSIDGKVMLETESKTNTFGYDVGVIYTSPRISKKAMIKIEVYDDDDNANPELILKAEGNIDSFLKDGYRDQQIEVKRLGYRYTPTTNFIDTVSFWQDEYDYKNV